jgi:hypothetical protein
MDDFRYLGKAADTAITTAMGADRPTDRNDASFESVSQPRSTHISLLGKVQASTVTAQVERLELVPIDLPEFLMASTEEDSMKVALLGATGFVGSALLKEALSDANAEAPTSVWTFMSRFPFASARGSNTLEIGIWCPMRTGVSFLSSYRCKPKTMGHDLGTLKP